MAVFNFTLTISGGLTVDAVDALFEAGCGDMTFQGNEAGPSYADVTRVATSFVEAVVSAIRDIEKVDGLVVEAADADELVTAAEIAERIKVTRETVRLWITGERRPDQQFPSPLHRLRSRNKLWLWADVVGWSNEHLGTALDAGHGAEVAAINGALAVRRGEPQLAPPARVAIHDLVEA
jgi:DNA-binding transcriptional regulator YiaG